MKDLSPQEQMILKYNQTQQDADEPADQKLTKIENNPVETENPDEDINLSNPFLALPNELITYILSQMPPQDLLNTRLMSKFKKEVVDATLEMITRPHYIINHLNQMDGITGNQFTAFYQRTRRYQELKRKVLAKEVLTAEEAVCYTLTRDSNVLPANLKKAMHELKLDDQTREHLKLILFTSKKIKTHTNKLKGYSHYSIELQNKAMEDVLINLINLLKQYHPQRFVNLLAGVNLCGLQFLDVDFSHLNLNGIQLSNSDLSRAKFRGAYLEGANFNGALLRDTDFTDAKLKGIQLNRATLDGVDLSTTDISGVDFEWAFIGNIKLLPKGALESPAALQEALSQFEKNIAKHSNGSRRKLEEHILQEIAEHIEKDPQFIMKEKIDFLDMAISIIQPDNLILGVFPFQNACHNLKEKLTQSLPIQQTQDHPLKKEAQDILFRMFNILYGNRIDVKEMEPKAPSPIPKKLYRTEYGLLMDCIKKYPELNDGLKVAKALGISVEIWHLIYISCPGPIFQPIRPLLLDFYQTQKTSETQEKRYASEVFNGFEFEIQNLQKIKMDHLNQYLYGEEDFVILENSGRTEVHVKLGDLFITFCPGGKGSVVSSVEIIDFEKHERKPAFSIDLMRYGNIPFEAFVPLNPYLNYSDATAVGWHLTVEEIKSIEEGYLLKKQIIERIFVSEKINRNRKNELFYPIFALHEKREQSYLAELPVELLEMACTFVHANTFRGRKKSSSPAVEVQQSHELFFIEKLNSAQEKAESQPPTNNPDKRKEKEYAEKENQPLQTEKIVAPKRHGLFTTNQNTIVPNPIISETSSQTRTKITSSQTTKTVSSTALSQGPRMFPAVQSGSQQDIAGAQAEGHRPWRPINSIALPNSSSGSCVVS